jgi:hypothetical protein
MDRYPRSVYVCVYVSLFNVRAEARDQVTCLKSPSKGKGRREKKAPGFLSSFINISVL